MNDDLRLSLVDLPEQRMKKGAHLPSICQGQFVPPQLVLRRPCHLGTRHTQAGYHGLSEDGSPCLLIPCIVLLNGGDEPIAVAHNSLDASLRMSVVPNGPACLDHTLYEGPVLHTLPTPEVRNELIFRNSLATMLNKIHQNIKN